MNSIRCNEPLPEFKKSVISVGNFDGIHTGHQKIVQAVCQRARLLQAQSIIVTFEPHTRAFLNPRNTPPRLTTFEEKAMLLRNFDLDYLVCLPFNSELASMGPDEFLQKILLERFKTVEWILGENHTFGRNKEGTYNFLHKSHAKNHINIFIINLQNENRIVTSSTKIRTFIDKNRIDEAVSMLGHPYLIIAERIRGKRIGTTLGYPTLNFRCPPSNKVIPPSGVYAAQVEFGDYVLKGALYFGNCPTFENRDYHFEFHSLENVPVDPGMNTKVALWLLQFVRADKPFCSTSDLIEQINNDIKHVKQFFT